MAQAPPIQHRIVFGDDHSFSADIAWKWITVHNWHQWEVDIVSVTDPDPTLLALITYEPLHEVQPEQPRVIPQACGLTGVRYLTTAGDPRIVLGEEIEGGVTVIGARGSGLLKAMHLGSTADWLARCPSTPLVIARRPERVRTVLACVDGSSHAATAVKVLAAMPWIAGTDVTVLAVSLEHDEDPALPSLRDSVEECANTLRSVGARVSVIVVLPEPTVVLQNVKYTIFDTIDSLSPDLVSMGTKGRRGLSRALLGSVANEVSHYADCSVLLARG